MDKNVDLIVVLVVLSVAAVAAGIVCLSAAVRHRPFEATAGALMMVGMACMAGVLVWIERWRFGSRRR